MSCDPEKCDGDLCKKDVRETNTLTRNGDKYNLLIQDEKGRVLLCKRDITFQEAVAELENRVYVTEENEATEQEGEINGIHENPQHFQA